MATRHQPYALHTSRQPGMPPLCAVADHSHLPRLAVSSSGTGTLQHLTIANGLATAVRNSTLHKIRVSKQICKERSPVLCLAKRSRSGSALDVDKANQDSLSESSGVEPRANPACYLVQCYYILLWRMKADQLKSIAHVA